MEAPSVFIRVSNVSLNNFELSNYCHVLFLIPRLHVKFGMINEEKNKQSEKSSLQNYVDAVLVPGNIWWFIC